MLLHLLLRVIPLGGHLHPGPPYPLSEMFVVNEDVEKWLGLD